MNSPTRRKNEQEGRQQAILPPLKVESGNRGNSNPILNAESPTGAQTEPETVENAKIDSTAAALLSPFVSLFSTVNRDIQLVAHEFLLTLVLSKNSLKTSFSTFFCQIQL